MLVRAPILAPSVRFRCGNGSTVLVRIVAHTRVLTRDSPGRILRAIIEKCQWRGTLPVAGAFTMTPAELRVRAERVRVLARSVAHDEAAPILRAFADELEAKAKAREVCEERNSGQGGRCQDTVVVADHDHRTQD
jgi:hypothetical protein